MYDRTFKVAEKLLEAGYEVYVLDEALEEIVAIKGNAVFVGGYCSKHIKSRFCRREDVAFSVPVDDGHYVFVETDVGEVEEIIAKYTTITRVPLLPQKVADLSTFAITITALATKLEELKVIREWLREKSEEVKEMYSEGIYTREELEEKSRDIIAEYNRARKSIMDYISEFFDNMEVVYERPPSELYDTDYWRETVRGSDTEQPLPFSKINNVWKLVFPATGVYASEGYVLETDRGWFYVYIRGYAEGYAVEFYRLDTEEGKVYKIQCEYRFEYDEELGLRHSPTECREVPLELAKAEWVRINELIREELKRHEEEK